MISIELHEINTSLTDLKIKLAHALLREENYRIHLESSRKSLEASILMFEQCKEKLKKYISNDLIDLDFYQALKTDCVNSEDMVEQFSIEKAKSESNLLRTSQEIKECRSLIDSLTKERDKWNEIIAFPHNKK